MSLLSSEFTFLSFGHTHLAYNCIVPHDFSSTVLMHLILVLLIFIIYCFIKITSAKCIKVKDHINMRLYTIQGVHVCIWCSLLDQYLPIRLVLADKG